MDLQERYYAYWGLTKPPFENIPDPEMYFDLHRSVDYAVSEILFAIEEGTECLAVVFGDMGLGKTMTLRVILDSIERDNYRVAFVKNPDMTFIQLLKSIIGQLSGKLCAESRRKPIIEIFNRLLARTHTQRKKALIFIDEANALKPSTLDSLRLLTNLQGDDKNLFTIILAGQLELARRLEQPRRAHIFQRISVYCHLEKIESLDLMRDYIEHRLECAGSVRQIFTDEAYDIIWEYSKQGVPRLINKLAKLALKAGQRHGVERIEAAMVRQLGVRFDRLDKPISPEGRRRVRTRRPVVQEKTANSVLRAELVSSISLMPGPLLPPVERAVGRPEGMEDIGVPPAPSIPPEDL